MQSLGQAWGAGVGALHFLPVLHPGHPAAQLSGVLTDGRMHLRPGRAAVVQGPAWQETTQRSRGEERRGATAMGPGRRVGVAKCQMLVTCFLVLLLSISMATAMALLHFEDRFAVVSRASVDSNPLEAVHRWVFSMGISLAGLLSLGATLSAAATMREAPGLLAMDHKTEPLTSVSGAASLHTSCQPTQATRLHTVTRPLCSQGFLCFALVFCSLVQVAFWRFHNPTQVEDTMLDTYDLVYDQAVRSPSSIQGPELAAIQDTFLCCGKRSPFQLLGSREADPCRGEEAAREVRSRQSLLAKQDAGLGQSPTDILDLVFPTPSEPSWKGLGKGPLGGRQQVATVQEAHSSQLDPGLSRGPFCQLDTRHGLQSPLHTAPSWVLPKARWTDPQKLLEAYRKGLCAGTQRGYRVWLGEAAGRAFQEDS
ncbi:tetraspanin-32 isoform X2 [Marmota marmota marmota]|uniref:tetraspanin-32 isoform X2 n=1 Tax=Marmota marmota marmota TaxID=9994 RepID=UPI002093F6E1|nr:tetraspanin-32 isoform X2 [Marmota marmota marmota]